MKHVDALAEFTGDAVKQEWSIIVTGSQAQVTGVGKRSCRVPSLVY